MATPFTHRNLPTLLLQSRESVMRYFRPNLRRHGLTDQKWRVLRAIDEQGALEVGRIAELCAILGPSLTGVLERMERDGLVKRRRVSADQRKVVVSLTPKGRRIIERIAGFVEAQYATIARELGQERLEQLYGLLDAVNALPQPPE